MICSESLLHNTSVVDLFCGVGGLSFGFAACGFKISAGIDVDENCRFPFQENLNAPFVRRDIGSIKPVELEELFVPNRTRVLIGCAPCQPFSTYNQKNNDPKWRLLDDFSDLIATTKPEIVSMENVPQLLRFRGGKIFHRFVSNLEKADYKINFDTLFAPDFGLPQSRSRLVLLASQFGKIELPKPTHLQKYCTVRDAISRLPKLEAGEADAQDPLHRTSRLSETNLRRIQASVPGGTWRDWDENLVAACHQIKTGRGYASVYGRMKWDEPAPTVTTQFFGFGNGRFGHPEQDRALSLREGAILQGFPEDYKFVPPHEPIRMKYVGQMIGNAVPVTLAKAIARSVASHLMESANA